MVFAGGCGPEMVRRGEALAGVRDVVCGACGGFNVTLDPVVKVLVLGRGSSQREANPSRLQTAETGNPLDCSRSGYHEQRNSIYKHPSPYSILPARKRRLALHSWLHFMLNAAPGHPYIHEQCLAIYPAQHSSVPLGTIHQTRNFPEISYYLQHRTRLKLGPVGCALPVPVVPEDLTRIAIYRKPTDATPVRAFLPGQASLLNSILPWIQS